MDHDYSTKQFGVCFTCEGQLRSDPCVETLVCEQCRRKGERGSVVGVGQSVLAYNPLSKTVFLTSAAIVRRYDYCPVIWGSGMHIQYEWYRRATGPRRKIPAATTPVEDDRHHNDANTHRSTTGTFRTSSPRSKIHPPQEEDSLWNLGRYEDLGEPIFYQVSGSVQCFLNPV